MTSSVKRKVIAVGLGVCLAAMLSVGTWAYFTSEATATNVITVGDVSIRLVERFDEQAARHIVPGESVEKIVFVENDGSNPAWVRVRLGVEVRSAAGEALSADPVVMHFAGLAGANAWADGGDGWHYLSVPLPAGVSSAALIDAVSLDASAGNDYAGAVVTVTASAQAVQCVHNGTDAADAVGWPAEEARI